jgi:hypothetical protein
MLDLTESERQALVGPVVVGCVLGAFAALASLGFDSEYSHIDRWRMALNALGAFAAALAITTVPPGVLPVVIQRFRRRHGPTADEERR